MKFLFSPRMWIATASCLFAVTAGLRLSAQVEKAAVPTVAQVFDDTIVVCGSEFGRTPVAEVGAGAGGQGTGRDHNPFGFSMWLAGGGIKGGTVYGATDDFGFKAIEKPVHVHDPHATILHLLGIDHTKLTYRYSGRDFRLTDVSGNVIKEILA